LILLLCGGDKSTQKRDIASAHEIAAELERMIMALKTVRWDVVDHLGTPEAIANYLEAVFEIGDPQLVIAALGDVARARGMTALAKDTGVSRESLYKSLAKEGNPEFATVMKVVGALGLRITAEVVERTSAKKRADAKAPTPRRARAHARKTA
jgi:probable addiction module antidote protein